jgi:signal transduction histidine kinase
MKRPKWLKRRVRTLSLRTWLILAVAAVIGTGVCVQFSLTAPVSLWEQQTADARLASARQIIGTDAARWHDPTWQRHVDASLATLGVSVALFPAQSVTAVYVSPGAQQFMADSGQYSAGGTANQAPAASQADTSVQLVFHRIVISNPAHPATRPPVGVILLWDTSQSSGALLGFLWGAVELGTFALALAVVVWLMGQPVVRPLTEMSQAVEDIAGGDLHVHLLQSPVREIAEVSAALEGMSGALSEALASQAALEEQRRLFVSAIAHDLRTPLFMLRGHLKGLERGVAATPEKIAQYVDACRVQADALERLIADLFAYARLEYLEQEPEHAPLELGALLRQAVAIAQPRADARRITLVLDTPGEPCPLLGDGRLLARAVENLLDNALRYTPEGGRIRLRWSREGDNIRFAVDDSGPGIAAHDLPHLFTPLYRSEASRSRQTGGAGLGLTIARRILRAHGGDLTAANGPDGGAIFTGSLPAARRSVTPAADLVTAQG